MTMSSDRTQTRVFRVVYDKIRWALFWPPFVLAVFNQSPNHQATTSLSGINHARRFSIRKRQARDIHTVTNSPVTSRRTTRETPKKNTSNNDRALSEATNNPIVITGCPIISSEYQSTAFLSYRKEKKCIFDFSVSTSNALECKELHIVFF